MKKESVASIDENAPAERSTVIQPLIEMLDYAMIGGAELKLPKFVFLLRAASEELTNSLEQAADDSEAATVDGVVSVPPPDRS
jgi:hypothetical protein